MLEISRDSNKKSTTAVIENARHDALNHVHKVFNSYSVNHQKSEDAEAISKCPCGDKLLMSDKFYGTVSLDPRDEYDEHVGESLAVKKAMGNHNRSYHNALKRWQVQMLKLVYAANPVTFMQSVDKVVAEEKIK